MIRLEKIVYIVEDEVDIAAILYENLKTLEAIFPIKIKAQMFQSSFGLMEAIQSRIPDLMTLDINLQSGLNGHEMVATLHNSTLPLFPIIVVTGGTSSFEDCPSYKRCKDRGHMARHHSIIFLRKPLDVKYFTILSGKLLMR